MTSRIRKILTLAVSIAAGLVVAGCPNQGTGGTAGTIPDGLSPTLGSGSTAIGTSGTSSATNASGLTSVASNMSFSIIGVTVTAGASGGSAPPNFNLTFNASNPNNNLNDVCQASGAAAGGSGGSGNPGLACLCNYSWGVTNTSSSQVINRTNQSQPTSITPFQVQCPGPYVYNYPSELPVGTVLQVSLVPGPGNNSGFTTNTMNYTVQPANQNGAGNFQDVEGDSFINLYHYVCYDTRQRNTTISQASSQAGAAEGGSGGSGGSGAAILTANKFTIGPATLTAQAYYYDFYILANQPGNVSVTNGSFTCPTVNASGEQNFYPMDSQFALALQSSNTFQVQIFARTYLSSNVSPGTGGSGGGAGAGAGGGGSPNTGGVIGYAALPNADGTCPSFTDTSGLIRQTYRLRQYTAVYPIRYNGDGSTLDLAQPNNTIYILDRPVDKLSENPSKPITRLGPKPCPFSFATAQFGQTCSTSAALSGWSVDGTQIPGNPKCPIYPPLPQPTLSNVNTQVAEAVKPDGTLVIRPYRPFLSHYIENTTLLACAFQSTTPQDPPIVLSYDNSIFPNSNPANFYCANYYPQPGSIIPAAGNTFTQVPGSCSLGDSAAAIKTDKSYACSETYNPTASGPQTPSAGCCQVCSGTNCTAAGGGVTAAGRNAAFSPPRDLTKAQNPSQAEKLLPAAVPNLSSGGCYDPDDD